MAEKEAKKNKAEKTEKKVAKKAVKRERKPSALRKDHVKVLEFLSKDLPKRTSFKMVDIAKARFKDGPNITADRVARNSVRKPRQMGLVEICERGEYRLTPTGAAFCKNIKDYDVAPDMERETKPAKKKVAKKAVAKKTAKAEATKVAAKKTGKTAKKETAPKKAKKTKQADPDFPDDPEDEVKVVSKKNNKSDEPPAPLLSDEEEPAALEV